MSNFNYFMETPYSNPRKREQIIEKNTNEFPTEDKTETTVTNTSPELDPTTVVDKPNQCQDGDESIQEIIL